MRPFFPPNSIHQCSPAVRILFLSICFCVFSSSTFAQIDTIKLAQEPQWLKLLHFQRSSLLTFESEVDDETFFVSPSGKISPLAELEATIDTFKNDPLAACRYPARYEWLAYRLNWEQKTVPFEQCTELKEWFETINPKFVTLVFPAAYMNSPSSMFGHLFLRIDSSEIQNDLLAYSINYGATVNENDNSIVFTAKGLFGGYPGTVSILPYYEKVKEYNDIENRDMYEYRLRLNQTQTRRLILHIWELQHIKFDYFFLDENCAYRILSIIEVANPEISLLSQFYTQAIPSDIVRSLLKSDHVEKISFRPSLATSLWSRAKSLNETETKWVFRIVANPNELTGEEFNRLSQVQRISILDTANDYVRYQLTKTEASEELAKAGFAILTARSRIEGVKNGPPSSPEFRDDEGHNTNYWHVNFNSIDETERIQIATRSAYHRLTDPLPGYLAGAEISFFEIEAGITDGDVDLDRFSVLDLASLSVRNDYFQPLSWAFSLGTQRYYFNDHSSLGSKMSAFGGVTFGGENNKYFTLLGTSFFDFSNFSNENDGNIGLKTGWLRQTFEQQTLVQLEFHKSLSGGEFKYGELSLSHTFNFSKNKAINFEANRYQLANDFYNTLSIEYRIFL